MLDSARVGDGAGVDDGAAKVVGDKAAKVVGNCTVNGVVNGAAKVVEFAFDVYETGGIDGYGARVGDGAPVKNLTVASDNTIVSDDAL